MKAAIKWKIRQMRAEDYEATIALWRSIEGIVVSEFDTKKRISFYLRRNRGLSFVAVAENNIVGAILSGTDGRRGFIQLLAVKPEFRKRSIGSELVRRAVAAFNKIEITEIRIFVLSSNARASRFWKKNGWSAKPDIQVMSLRISPSS